MLPEPNILWRVAFTCTNTTLMSKQWWSPTHPLNAQTIFPLSHRKLSGFQIFFPSVTEMSYSSRQILKLCIKLISFNPWNVSISTIHDFQCYQICVQTFAYTCLKSRILLFEIENIFLDLWEEGSAKIVPVQCRVVLLSVATCAWSRDTLRHNTCFPPVLLYKVNTALVTQAADRQWGSSI